MKFTPLILASLASLAIAGPVPDGEKRSTDAAKLAEAIKNDNIISACLDKVEDAFVHCEEVLGKPRADCMQESEAEVTKCMPVLTLSQHVEMHCGRAENDKDACMFAARRCTGQIANDAVKPLKFLECVDIMQVCADQGAAGKLDECFDNATKCNEKEALPLGELTKLGQCAKKDL